MTSIEDRDRWWPAARRRIIESLLTRYLPKGRSYRILEAGSGPGWNLEMLAKFGEAHGLEPDDSFIENSKKASPDAVVHKDFIPLRLGTKFDLICMLDVLEHTADDAEAIEWASEHLSENGFLCITVPAFKRLWTEHDVLAHHYRRYEKQEALSLISSRFTPVYVSYFNIFLFLPALLWAKLGRASVAKHSRDLKSSRLEKIFNYPLKLIFGMERHLLKYASLPFGVSLFVLCKKNPFIFLSSMILLDDCVEAATHIAAYAFSWT